MYILCSAFFLRFLWLSMDCETVSANLDVAAMAILDLHLITQDIKTSASLYVGGSELSKDGV